MKTITLQLILALLLLQVGLSQADKKKKYRVEELSLHKKDGHNFYVTLRLTNLTNKKVYLRGHREGGIFNIYRQDENSSITRYSKYLKKNVVEKQVLTGSFEAHQEVVMLNSNSSMLVSVDFRKGFNLEQIENFVSVDVWIDCYKSSNVFSWENTIKIGIYNGK